MPTPRVPTDDGSADARRRCTVYAVEIVSEGDARGGYTWLIRFHGKTLRRSDERHPCVDRALRAVSAEIDTLLTPGRPGR